jgi:hypothetical protein
MYRVRDSTQEKNNPTKHLCENAQQAFRAKRSQQEWSYELSEWAKGSHT